MPASRTPHTPAPDDDLDLEPTAAAAAAPDADEQAQDALAREAHSQLQALRTRRADLETRRQQARDKQSALGLEAEVEALQDEIAELEDADALRNDGWDGRLTALRLARPIKRDNRLLEEGRTVRVRAYFDAAQARWRGPEGEHVADLQRLGVFDGPAARRRDQVQVLVDAERGVGEVLLDSEDPNVQLRDPDSGEPLVLESLRERRGADLRTLLRHHFSGGPEEMVRRERQESQADDRDRAVWDGASAPGSRTAAAGASTAPPR